MNIFDLRINIYGENLRIDLMNLNVYKLIIDYNCKKFDVCMKI